MSAIHLHGAELRGYLSEAVGNLGQLQILRLRGNHLSGTILPSLANCSQLRALYLYQNDFSDPIPAEIVTGSGALQQPEVLHPASNSLTGSIPVQIGNLKRLRLLEESRHRYHSHQVWEIVLFSQPYHSNKTSSPESCHQS